MEIKRSNTISNRGELENLETYKALKRHGWEVAYQTNWWFSQPIYFDEIIRYLAFMFQAGTGKEIRVGNDLRSDRQQPYYLLLCRMCDRRVAAEIDEYYKKKENGKHK